MKKIFLIGDPCIDCLIYDDSYRPPIKDGSNYYNWQNSGYASVMKSPGGVLLLANFIKDAIPDISVHTYELDLDSHSDTLINSFAEIRNFKEKKNGKDIDHFRIHQFKGFSGPKIQAAQILIKDNSDIAQADVIVIDDVGNGFRNSDQTWIQQVLIANRKPLILHKINLPLINNGLIDSIDDTMAAQHIVVINSDDIRQSGVQISSKLSWDKTIDDFIKSFSKDARLYPFKNCAFLIIRFGLEATLVIKNPLAGRKKNCLPDDCDFKLLYFPDLFEGQFYSQVSGMMQGISCAFHTALVQNLLEVSELTEVASSELIESGVIHGMEAAVGCLQIGFQRNENGTMSYPIKDYLAKRKSEIRSVKLNNFLNQKDSLPSLLKNQVHGDEAGILYGALELVKSGEIRGSMTNVPFVKFGALTSADREEIESYRSIRALLEEYIANTANTTPLSIGVFGPPGSGKSFGVKQIAGMFGDRFVKLEFNLSQFNSADELCRAFQEVRDVNLKGKIPLVFFDEFDTALGEHELGWLKFFLAPMQDGEFREGEKIHPVGRGIFVFAGGTSYTYESFEMPEMEGADDNDITKKNAALAENRKKLKVPDFLSRLRGFINVKGINRYSSSPDKDAAFMVRRALVLRHHLSKIDGIITRGVNKEISIDRDLLRAFLTIPDLKHGARSLEAIIGMSSLKGARIYSRSCLPADHLLKMHLDVEKFTKEINMNNEYTLDDKFLSAYGKKAHEIYVNNEKKKGETVNTNSSIVPWEELSDHDKESNRQQGVDATLKLAAFNCSIRPKGTNSTSVNELSPEEIETMAIMEHERWMIYKQKEGWSYAPGKKNKDAKTNPCIAPWGELPEDERDKDRIAVSMIPKILDQCGYEIYELPKD